MEVTINDPFWQGYVERVNRILPVKPQTDNSSKKPQVDIYTRVSIEEQKKGYSIEMQVHESIPSPLRKH